MAISEEKMRIVIDNYFKTECDVNTSIRQAFEKGFRIGVKKGLSAQPEIVRCKERKQGEWDMFNLITSVYFGKQYYFPEEDGIVYSRQSGKNMTQEKAIQEFLDIIGE